MHTKDILAAELRKAGLNEMADKAATGHYHDFLSPLNFPDLQLAVDLATAGTPAALALRARHLNGEFDATTEESEAWAASADGQDAMAKLIADKPRLGDAPIEDKYAGRMNELARFIDMQFNGEARPRKTGFVLLVFPFGEGGRCNYISNGADRKDIVALMREQIKQFEGKPT